MQSFPSLALCISKRLLSLISFLFVFVRSPVLQFVNLPSTILNHTYGMHFYVCVEQGSDCHSASLRGISKPTCLEYHSHLQLRAHDISIIYNDQRYCWFQTMHSCEVSFTNGVILSQRCMKLSGWIVIDTRKE